MTPPRRPAPRWLLAACLPLVLLLAGVAVRAWLQGDGMRSRVQDRVKRALEPRLGPVRLGDDFHVGWTGTVSLGPLELPGAQPEGPPVVRIERITVRPRLRSLLSGHVEASQVVLSNVTLEAGPSGRDVRALVTRMRAPHPSPAATSAPDAGRVWPEVVVEELHLAFERHGRVEWGPLSARVSRRDREGVRGLEATATLPGGGRAELTVSDAASGPEGTLEVHEAVAGSVLALAEPPWRLEGGVLEGKAHVEGAQASFSLTVKGLSVSDPRLAPEPVGPLAFSLEGHGAWDRERRHVKLEPLEVTVGAHREARIELTAEADWTETPHFSVKAELQPLTFEQALGALPPPLVPDEPVLTKLEGHFQGTLSVSGPVARREEWEVKAKLDVSKPGATEPAGPLAWLRAPFDYRPLTAEGHGRQLRIGPESPHYVPLPELPRALVRAVLRSEDAAFWVHRGFDFDSLETLLLKPSDGRVRGGSTLTQQLAKNLFLSREKTYARKVKEAYLTLGLETSVSKDRLLEVYFNIIEWGPDVYGIGEAARHYFGKEARALDIRESAFLATIIPNPVRYHVYCTRGELTENWKKNVDSLLGLLHEGGDLSSTEYQEALDAPLHFACGASARPEEEEQTPAQ